MKRFVQYLAEMNDPSSTGFAPIDRDVAQKLVRHYMDPVSHLEAQEESLRLTKQEMDALGLIKRTSQKIGMNLQSNVINIIDVVSYLNLLSNLQNTDLRRIANYIDNIRGGVYSDLVPYIKKVNPNFSMD